MTLGVDFNTVYAYGRMYVSLFLDIFVAPFMNLREAVLCSSLCPKQPCSLGHGATGGDNWTSVVPTNVAVG